MADPSSDLNFNWGSLLPALAGVGALAGSASQAGAQNNSASLAQQFAQATGTLNPFTAGTGAGGIGASMSGGNVGLNYGSLQNPYNGFVGLAGNTPQIGLPPGLSPAISGAFGQASGGLGGMNSALPGFAANSAFLGAGNAAQLAGQGPQGLASQYLQNINQIQQPQIQQQFDMLQNSLFGNGQLGASSGALQTQAFGRGLSQLDSQNNLAAMQLGLQGQQTNTQAASALGSLGGNLLNSAFGNFNNAAGLAPAIQGQTTGNAVNALQGAGSIEQQGLGLFNAGLQTSLGQNQASARAGSLSTTNANSPNQQSPYGQLLQSLFGGYLNQSAGGTGLNSNVINSLSKLFGGGIDGSALYGSIGNLTSGSGSYLSGQLGDAAAINPDTSTDFSNLFGDSFNGAGGQAASSGGSGLATGVGAAGGAAGLASAFGGAAGAAPAASAVGIYGMDGGLLAGSSLGAADAAAAGGAAAGAGASAGGAAAGGGAAGAGSAAGVGALGTAAAGTGAAALFALPIMAAFGLLPDSTVPTGASFVQSIQGSPYFSPAQQQQIQQAYSQVGEAGIGQYMAQNFPAFAQAAGGARAPHKAVRQI